MKSTKLGIFLFLFVLKCSLPSVLFAQAPYAQESYICPLENITAPEGDSLLNLNLTYIIGGNLTNQINTIIPSGSTNYLVDSSGSCYTSSELLGLQSKIKFNVLENGTYTFSNSDNPPRPLTLISDSGINCNNFISSNMTLNSMGNWFTTSPSVSVTLSECQSYFLLIGGFQGNQVSANISGPLNILLPENLVPGFSYNYIAVNQINNKIGAVSSNSNFSMLPKGNYDVFGVTYNVNSENPNDWDCVNLSELTDNSNCITISDNFISLNITSDSIKHSACETCSDGILNGDELGIDCGGNLCSFCISGCTTSYAHNFNPSAQVDDGSCETCFDAIQNGPETEIDCGDITLRCRPCNIDEGDDFELQPDTSYQLNYDVSRTFWTNGTTEEIIIEDDFNVEAGYMIILYPPITLNPMVNADMMLQINPILYPVNFTSPEDSSTPSRIQSKKKSKNVTDLIFSVFPNPTEEWLNIQITSNRSSNLSIEVIDVFGKNMIKINTVANHQKINTQLWNTGTYFLLIKLDNQIIRSERIIIL